MKLKICTECTFTREGFLKKKREIFRTLDPHPSIFRKKYCALLSLCSCCVGTVEMCTQCTLSLAAQLQNTLSPFTSNAHYTPHTAPSYPPYIHTYIQFQYEVGLREAPLKKGSSGHILIKHMHFPFLGGRGFSNMRSVVVGL